MTPLSAVIFSYVLLALAGACGAYYGVVRGRAAMIARRQPTLYHGIEEEGPVGGWPDLCVVVPAHNEERGIGDHAATLLAQEYPGELHIVWALDRCTDRTREILEEAIANAGPEAPASTIVEIDACPDGWAGKVHAVHAGVLGSPHAQHADLLLFADADTTYEPLALRAAVAMKHLLGVRMLSLLCTLTHRQEFERRVQPAAGFELVRRFPLDRVNRPERGLRFANGQFMLFDRAAYDAIGGHEAVKNALLEDLQFARLLRHPNHDMRIAVLRADGVVRCKMYEDYASFRKGWKRIYTESMHRKPGALRSAGIRLRLVGSVLPFMTIACSGGGLGAFVFLRDPPLGISMLLMGVLGRLLYFGAMARIYKLQGAPVGDVRWYPVGAWKVGGILLEAARDLREGNPTEWGGKSYARPVN